jgi:hypothetical protein
MKRNSAAQRIADANRALGLSPSQPRSSKKPIVQGNKFDGNIKKVIALVDTRHDFGDASKDTYITIANQKLDFFRNFTNNIQRLALFGNDAEAKKLSHYLTSICKGRVVMGGAPEDPFVEYVEENAGIPKTPRAADAAIWNNIRQTVDGRMLAGQGGAGSAGWNGGIDGGELLANGFQKIIIPSISTVAGDDDNTWNIANGEDNYRKYHKAIAQALGWSDATRRPIPVVVDTTKSLHHSSDPYFLICLNNECIADPSPTSSMKFPFVAIEPTGPQRRSYDINNVRYVVSKSDNGNITIDYIIGEPDVLPAADAPINATYNFSGQGIKPNSIEVCKGNINDKVNDIITAAGGDTTRYQTIGGTAATRAVAALVALFNAECGIYNNLSYPIAAEGGLVTPNVKKEIVIPYIAKRGGDQLQAASCSHTITYTLKRPRGVRKPTGQVDYTFEYVSVNAEGIESADINVTINNAVFWTYDRVAAMFAVLMGITTVLQTGSKDAIIYKRIDSDFSFTTIPPPLQPPFSVSAGWAPVIASRQVVRAAGGSLALPIHIPRPPKYTKGGAICTRAQNRITGRINLACFYNNLADLCTPFGPLYDAFTLLDILIYYNFIRGNTLRLNNIHENKTLILCVDRCIRLDNTINKDIITSARGAAGPGSDILETPANNIKYIGGPNNTIAVNGIRLDIDGLGGAGAEPSLIQILRQYNPVRPRNGNQDGLGINDEEYLARYGLQEVRRNGIIAGGNGSGTKSSQSFYDLWANTQLKYNLEGAHLLFYKFIYLLAICENRYFSVRDSADNFYVYDTVPVRYGGHTQITMMAFLDEFIAEYKKAKSNPADLDTFLQMFIYFPFLCKKYNRNDILIDLIEYINVWFHYQEVTANAPGWSEGNKADILFRKIITTSQAKANSIQIQLPTNDELCANYLYKIYPHGHFVLQLNSISPAPISSASISKIVVKTSTLGKPNTTMKPMASPSKYQPPNYSKGRQGVRKGTLARLTNGYSNNNNNNMNGYESAATVNNAHPPSKRLGYAYGGKKRVTRKKLIKRRISTLKRKHNKKHTKKRNHKKHTKKT